VSNSPLDLMKTKPYGFPLMAPAFIGLASYLISEPKAVEAFAKETGLDLSILENRSAVEKMIDQAAGMERDLFIAWLDWVAVNHWGVEENQPITIH
jgi:hypothetical protein